MVQLKRFPNRNISLGKNWLLPPYMLALKTIFTVTKCDEKGISVKNNNWMEQSDYIKKKTRQYVDM